MKLTALAATCICVFAQTPQFDVASVKRSPPPESDRIVINLGRALNGMVTLGNATLADCIQFAYGLASEQQIAGPEWISGRTPARFDIVAKAPPDTPRETLLLMLQSLLTERLK